MPLYSIRINFFSDGSLNVNGFPNSLDMALSSMDQAKNTVIKYFIKAAKENRLNDQNIVDGGNIVVPKRTIKL